MPKRKTAPKFGRAMLITPAMLREHGARCSELARFKRRWPNGVRATLANCMVAAKADFDFWWAAMELLSKTAFRHFDKRQYELCVTGPGHRNVKRLSDCPGCRQAAKAKARAFWEASRLIE
jgi:hypothetical protein